MSTISRAVERTDSTAKSAGEAVYLADLRIDGALTAGLVLCERPRARLLGVEVAPLPEGYFAVGRRDVPGLNAVHMINDSWPLFPEQTVEYVGQPILVIAGPDPGEVRRLVAATRVEYEDLLPVFGIDGAEALDAPDCFVDYSVHGSPGPADAPPPRETSASARHQPRAATGRPTTATESAPALSDPFSAALTETFDTGAQEHLYLETQAMAAWCENGRLTVMGSMQCPFYVKRALEGVFGWEPERIRVVQTTTGGAFGGKEEYPSVLACYVAVAAHKSRRPVRIVLDRGEDIRTTTKRHPSRITLTSRLRQDHTAGEASPRGEASAGGQTGAAND
ncbi:MAG: molybdopterin cofactor-binding domain-containing protein, partial [Spirochaetota bacterium]